MSRRSSTAVALLALVAAFAVACTGGTSPPSATPAPTPVKVAFLQDLTVPGASQLVAPSLLGLELALERAAERNDLPVVPDVETMDTQGDRGRLAELAQQIADDPAFVAVVEGPFMHLSEVSGDTLGKAGIPTISLSGWDDDAVDRIAVVARGASALALCAPPSSRRSVDRRLPFQGCVWLDDASSYGDALAALVRSRLGGDRIALEDDVSDGGPLAGVVERIRRSACGTVGWTGFASSIAAVRTALTRGGLASIDVVGADPMKADSYLSETDGAGDGTIVTCACADLASSTRPEAGRFIHDFQSRFGSPPGAFAAEGWDVGGMLTAAFATEPRIARPWRPRSAPRLVRRAGEHLPLLGGRGVGARLRPDAYVPRRGVAVDTARRV